MKNNLNYKIEGFKYPRRSIGLATKMAFKGFVSPIKYEVRVSDADWSKYFGHYQNQKWGQWDSNSCWCLGGVINCAEDQFEYLWKNGMFSKEAKDFFTNNGYIDEDGDFSFSERFLEILGGLKDNGGTIDYGWDLAQKYGFLPRSMLNYSHERAAMWSNRQDFIADYFGKGNITQGMRDLAKQCLKYIKIEYQRIGTTWKTPERQVIEAALRQAPISYGVPVAYPWNTEEVKYDGTTNPAHVVEGYKIWKDGRYATFDQYEPHLKNLSANYYIPFITQGVVTAVPQAATNPVKQTVWNLVWEAVFKWYQDFWQRFPA
jgi:hypothetical protein